MKKTTKNTLISSLIFLSACHQDNPLKTQTVHESVVFLMNASANAEKRLHFPIPKDALGFGYLECMEGKKSREIRCEELLRGMISFAQENHYPAFKRITLAELKNTDVFKKIGDEYAIIASSTWPQFFPETSHE